MEMKNNLVWWFEEEKKLGQPNLIVDVAAEPVASDIIFNRTLWYRDCG